MRDVTGQRERVNQKRRTRAALVQAARELLEQAGRRPSRTSPTRRSFPAPPPTVTSHPKSIFSSMSCSSARSTKSTARSPPPLAQPTPPLASRDSSPRSRRRSPRTRPGSAGCCSSRSRSPPDQPTVASIRGERRLQWIGQALEPIASEIDMDSLRRLTSALALCVGAEAFIILRDLCGLTSEEADDTLRQRRALFSAARSEAQRGKPRGTKRTTANT